MINILYKIISLMAIVCFAFAVFFLGQLPLNEGKNLFKPYIDTQFSEEFDFKKFETIKIGMTLTDIEAALGQPLSKSEVSSKPNNRTYHYTSDGKMLKIAKEKKGMKYRDFAWYSISVTFNASNILTSIDEGWIHD